MNDLDKKIIKNPIISFIFSEFDGVYLVGGYIRDMLLTGNKSKDLDFVVPKNIRPIVQRISERFGGSIVELRQEHMTRVCRKDGTTIDFSKMLGEIDEDLGKRDYTMNSIAWSPKTGIIDPHCGISDIKKKTIRTVSENNIRNDPLRTLRAYRFAGELSFDIDKNTQKILRKYADLLKISASERITYEFIRLIDSEFHEKAIEMAYNDSILKTLIYINDNKLENNVNQIHKINLNLKKVPERYFFKDYSQGISHAGLIRLEALLSGSFSNRFILSRTNQNHLLSAAKLIVKFNGIKGLGKTEELYGLFNEAGDSLIDLLVLSGRANLIKHADLFIKIQNKPVLSASEIMSHTGMKEGKKLGDLLNAIKILNFTGEINDKKSALKHIKNLT